MFHPANAANTTIDLAACGPGGLCSCFEGNKVFCITTIVPLLPANTRELTVTDLETPSLLDQNVWPSNLTRLTLLAGRLAVFPRPPAPLAQLVAIDLSVRPRGQMGVALSLVR